MIAYDIDGVFIADLCNLPTPYPQHFTTWRCEHLVPIFQPEGRYVLLTGRSGPDIELTRDWIKKHFDPAPQDLYHYEGPWNIESVREFKAQTLIRHYRTIHTFVESDEETVKHVIKRLREEQILGLKVLHFAEFIRQKMRDY